MIQSRGAVGGSRGIAVAVAVAVTVTETLGGVGAVTVRADVADAGAVGAFQLVQAAGV